jgi:hypothetical protein
MALEAANEASPRASMTWVMIIVAGLGTQNYGINVSSVPGFTSEEKCAKAALEVIKAGDAATILIQTPAALHGTNKPLVICEPQ